MNLIHRVSGCGFQERMDVLQVIVTYGQGYLHCKAVEDYLASHGFCSNINLQRKAVLHNHQNLEKLKIKINFAGIPNEFIGIPFLCESDNCRAGEEDITGFSSNKTSIRLKRKNTSLWLTGCERLVLLRCCLDSAVETGCFFGFDKL